jgi:HIT zinc finger
MAQNHLFSILPVVNPTWKRTTHTSDIESIVTYSTTTCLVCQKNNAHYKCPKCALSYCSVACYKDHNETCSEAFYRERVNSVLTLEQNEGTDQIHSILHRFQNDNDHEEGEADERLWLLAEALEKRSLTDEDVERLLSPDMKDAFHLAINTGQLQDSIRPWYPWWMPNYTAEKDPNAYTAVSDEKTLDERLLAVPSFSSICRATTTSHQLAYNLIDLLYCSALTLRQYHGIDNAKFASEEAAQSLIQASAVLRDDARHCSVVESLVSCTSTKRSIDWKVLVHDVARLWNRRCLARVLLDDIVLLKAASRTISREDANIMRRHRKKIEFYLSWSLEACLPVEVVKEIEIWINDWSVQEEGQSLDYLANYT